MSTSFLRLGVVVVKNIVLTAEGSRTCRWAVRVSGFGFRTPALGVGACLGAEHVIDKHTHGLFPNKGLGFRV